MLFAKSILCFKTIPIASSAHNIRVGLMELGLFLFSAYNSTRPPDVASPMWPAEPPIISSKSHYNN